jgi:nucleoside-diphosphate-sugar epimerase
VDYVGEEPDAAMLSQFDAVVFAAGNDPRHVPKGEDINGWWHKANGLAVPRYAKAARDAGVAHFVLIGSFYPQAAPHLLGTNAYIDSRLAADEGVRALASDSFHVVVLNAPFIVGHVEGVEQPGARAYTSWAMGKMPQVPLTMIPGGVNVISTATLTDAIVGALENGENGKAYLVGDENLTFKQYLETYFRAAGNPVDLALDDAGHPMLGAGSVLGGIGSTLYYDPDPAEVTQLGYRRNDVERSIRELVEAYS